MESIGVEGWACGRWSVLAAVRCVIHEPVEKWVINLFNNSSMFSARSCRVFLAYSHLSLAQVRPVKTPPPHPSLHITHVS